MGEGALLATGFSSEDIAQRVGGESGSEKPRVFRGRRCILLGWAPAESDVGKGKQYTCVFSIQAEMNGIGTLLGRGSCGTGQATRPTTDSYASFRQQTNCEMHWAFNMKFLCISGKGCGVSTFMRT